MVCAVSFIVCAIVGSAVVFTVMSTIELPFRYWQYLRVKSCFSCGCDCFWFSFGDKMSPLSESTNLAAAIVEADLFKHIKT